MGRTERHLQLAEAGIRGHQAMTAAHVAGRKPVVRLATAGPPTTLWILGRGEFVIKDGFHWGATEEQLKELQAYWHRIPNFGLTARVYPSETGWAQVLDWSGTGDDGKIRHAHEVDVITTDADFNITRFEIYWDRQQWKDLFAFLDEGKTPIENYAERIAREPGSAAY